MTNTLRMIVDNLHDSTSLTATTEALAVANDTPFGLSAGICTASLKHASDFKRKSQAGMVMVNLPTGGNSSCFTLVE